jgi:hypothetical protein
VAEELLDGSYVVAAAEETAINFDVARAIPGTSASE